MITLITGEKGGTAKSTIAMNLAAMLACKGKDVLLVDTDPQASSSSWAQIRSENPNLPRVACVQIFGKSLTAELKDLSRRYDEIIVDAGGRDSIEMRAALIAANCAYIPVQASQLDLWTIDVDAELVELARGFNPDLTAKVIITRASTSFTNQDTMKARDHIKNFPNLTLSDAVICERVTFRRSIAEGMSVTESNIDSKACFEINKVFKEIYHGI